MLVLYSGRTLSAQRGEEDRRAKERWISIWPFMQVLGTAEEDESEHVYTYISLLMLLRISI